MMTKKSYKVILLFDQMRVTGRGIMRGVINYSRIYGPWKFHTLPPFYRRNQKRILTDISIKNLNADGIIMDDREVTENLIKSKLPFIAIDIESKIPNMANIYANEKKIGEIAAKHLMERGFKNFAYCGYDDLYWSHERSESFKKTLQKAGFETIFYHQPKSKINRKWENEQYILIRWLKTLPKPVAIFAGNDDRGKNVAAACKLAEFKIPDQVAVLGTDNDDLVCELSDPPLSSVALNWERAGFEAAELLEKLIQGKNIKKPTVIIQPTNVATRLSTDVLAIDDQDVCQAIRFIRDHSKELIQVNDVVDSVTLSRRVLEKRFRQILGLSIFEEIRRVRVNQIKTMLITTNMSILEIVMSVGYSNVHNVARYFKQETGLSMQDYRRQFGKRA